MPNWASVGSLGTSKIKSSQGYLDLHPSRAVPADSIVVVWLAADSGFSVFSGAGGEPYAAGIGCGDSAGNVYALLGGANDKRCFFLCGAGVYVFISQLRAPLSTGDYIRIEGDDYTASWVIEAKAMSAWEFTVPEGYGWCATGEDANFDVETGDPINISFTSPLNTEHLWIWALANEAPPTDVFTLDPDYTAIDSDGTTGGADSEMITIMGGFRVFTSNVDNVDVTNTTNSGRDSTQMLTAIMAVPKLTTFPRTPLIDDFNRAAEEPLDQPTVAGVPTSYNWDDDVATGPSSPGFRLLRSDGSQAAGGATNAGGQQVSPALTCDDAEVYATYAVVPGNGEFGVEMHLSGKSNEATLHGHTLMASNNHYGPHGWWKLVGGDVGLQGNVGHTGIFIWLPPYFLPTDGWRIGIQRWRKFMNIWVDNGGGWQWWGAYYRATASSGKLGIQIWDPVSRVDDFGGGPTCFMVNMNWREANRAKSATRGLVNPSDERY